MMCLLVLQPHMDLKFKRIYIGSLVEICAEQVRQCMML